MKKIKILIMVLTACVALVSCEVEFSPNAEWRETPVVYCLLDQDDDTSYVRIQRCFLGEGNQYRFASVADSNYYPQDALTVAIEEWNATMSANGVASITGNAPRRVYDFEYKEIVNKEEGRFYNKVQPVYACATAGQLDSTCIYRLVVVKNSTGDTIATSQTRLVYGDMSLSKPNNVTLFQFAGTSGSKSCELIWSSLENARQYQPVVRFFYREFSINTSVTPPDTIIKPYSIDIPCNVVKSNMRDPYVTTKLSQNYFLSTIKSSIADVASNKNIIDTVEIFINCCTEPLAAYIYANNPGGSFNQEPFLYTNIDGALGVFAARRCGISFRVPSPGSVMSNYIKELKALNVGF